MKRFVDLYHALSETTKSSEKVELLVSYLSAAGEQELGWAVHILRGGKLDRVVSSREIRVWAAECAGIPLWLFEESYHVVGDLAETTALTVSSHTGSHEDHESRDSLREWIELVRSLKGAPEQERKRATQDAWRQMSVAECLVFNKLLTGGLRIGVSRGLVGKALAQVVGLDEATVAHRLLASKDPDRFSLSDFTQPDSGREGQGCALTPYPFFLASPFDADLSLLGSHEEWCAEWKWDGIRAQCVVRGGHVAIWSRGEELVTESFPEFLGLTQLISDGTVLDGELVAWDTAHPAPFARLQQRLNRRKVSAKLVSEIPVKYIAYDLLELGARDLREKSIKVRRQKLAEILNAQVALLDRIELSPVISFASWEELAQQQKHARTLHAEGVMLKRWSSCYGVGRRRGEWWKWKVDPLTIDGVLMYAQKGHGRRADLFTDYTFGVWNGDVLVPFAKAYSGLTDQEIRQVDAFVKAHTRERFGPVRTVEQSLVFEIAFEGIQESSRHKSGIAVRFPRISRWRRDKPAAEADTLENLKALARKPKG